MIMTCVICGKKAKYKFSPDLDIEGIGACKKHLERVKLGYAVLMFGNNEKLAAELLNYKPDLLNSSK